MLTAALGILCAPPAHAVELDASFGSGGTVDLPAGAEYESVVRDAEGTLTVLGVGSTSGNPVLVRLESSGSLDDAFGDSGLLELDEAEALAPGLAGALFVAWSEEGDFKVTKLDETGNPVASFGDGGTASISGAGAENVVDQGSIAVAVDSANHVVIAGSAGTSGPLPGSNPRIAVARLEPTGGPDTSFDGDGFFRDSASTETWGEGARDVVVDTEGVGSIGVLADSFTGPLRVSDVVLGLDDTGGVTSRTRSPQVSLGLEAIPSGVVVSSRPTVDQGGTLGPTTLYSSTGWTAQLEVPDPGLPRAGGAVFGDAVLTDSGLVSLGPVACGRGVAAVNTMARVDPTTGALVSMGALPPAVELSVDLAESPEGLLVLAAAQSGSGGSLTQLDGLGEPPRPVCVEPAIDGSIDWTPKREKRLLRKGVVVSARCLPACVAHLELKVGRRWGARLGLGRKTLGVAVDHLGEVRRRFRIYLDQEASDALRAHKARRSPRLRLVRSAEYAW